MGIDLQFVTFTLRYRDRTIASQIIYFKLIDWATYLSNSGA